MKRLALILAAFSVLGTGCYVETSHPTGGVDVAWRFARYAPGGTTPLAYYGCTTGLGVDSVVVQFGNGPAQAVPCRDSVGDGALFASVTSGQQTITVTGRRGGVDVYHSSYVVDVVAGQTTPVDLDVAGIADDLDILPTLRTADGTLTYSSCADAGFANFRYDLVDSAGTVVASSSTSGVVACSSGGVADPNGFPDLMYQGNGAVDRDRYTIRLRAPETGTPAFDTDSINFGPCSQQTFDHTGTDTGANAWSPAMYDVSGLTRCAYP